MDEVVCRGDERSIFDCKRSIHVANCTYFSSDCTHEEDVGVSCQAPFGKTHLLNKIKNVIKFSRDYGQACRKSD